jgi:hypothetical protein
VGAVAQKGETLMTTPPPAHRASRYRLLGWASVLCLLPGLLAFLIGIITSSFSDPLTLISPLTRLGFALTGLGLLLMRLTLTVLRRLGPDWQVEMDRRAAIATRHPGLVPLAQWWGAGVSALAFALLAHAPDAIGGWFGPSSHGGPFALFAVLTCLDVLLLIAWSPLFLLYQFDRPR